MARLWQERNRESCCKVCKEMNFWFSLGQDWCWDAWWSLNIISKVREKRRYSEIPDLSTFTFR